ncbi:MAG: orotidine-5'-phosphate decarboxylase [Candidatus Omnitrophota bacterium]
MSGLWNKLIVALDLEQEAKIKEVVRVLSPQGVKFKIGSIAFNKFGPDFVKNFINQGIDIFLDLKLYDIPNTMAKTAAVITELGVWAFTVHLQAGVEALRRVKAAVEAAAEKLKQPKPLILGVSILTSSLATQAEVRALVDKANSVGLDGVIASPGDVAVIKCNFAKLKVITPGIRNPQDNKGDQKRVATASQAFANGADYIVVGRPIIEKEDYLAAAEAILAG